MIKDGSISLDSDKEKAGFVKNDDLPEEQKIIAKFEGEEKNQAVGKVYKYTMVKNYFRRS